MSIAPASLHWLFGRTAWSAWIILAASLAVTAVVGAMVRDNVRAEGQRRFDREVGRVAMAISNQIRVHAQVLRGAAGLFDVSPQVSRDTWRTYVDRLKLPQNYLGIQALGFAEIVTPDDVQEHVRWMRAAGFPDYEIEPDGERPVYAPVTLFEPVNPENIPALGFDMLSDPVRAEAAQYAVDTGDVVVSARVQVAQDVAAADRSGFVLLMPVFRGGTIPAEATIRRAEVAGYVFARFLSADFLGSILGGRQTQLRLRAYDGDGTDQSGPFFDSTRDGGLAGRPDFRLHPHGQDRPATASLDAAFRRAHRHVRREGSQ